MLRRLGKWLSEPGSLAVDFHGFGNSVRSSAWVPRLVHVPLLKFLYNVVELWTGVSLPLEVKIGTGLVIHHRGKVVIHPAVVLGDNVSIVHGVTIGNRKPGGPVPVIGDGVELGAYAQILGGVTVGDGARIGALCVVVDDVPAGATVLGPKGRIVE